jgi:hypothetical protein
MTFTKSWADIVETEECAKAKQAKQAELLVREKLSRKLLHSWILNYVYSGNKIRGKKKKKNTDDQYDLSMIIGKESLKKIHKAIKAPKTTRQITRQIKQPQSPKISACKPCTPLRSNYRTQMCKHLKNCRHYNCRFAHNRDELTVVTCRFGNKCKNGNKCTWIHDGETKDMYFCRMRIR